MSYKVAVRTDGQTDVPILVDPTDIEVGEDYEGTGLKVELAWAKYKLATRDPQGYQALTNAWPGEEELILSRQATGEQEWEEVFAGTVTKVHTDEHELCVAAHQRTLVPPNPLTVDVVRNSADPNRLSVLVAANNDGEGPVTLDFGDSTPTQSNSGNGADRNSHAYATAGAYTVTATDSNTPSRIAQEVVTVPYPA